MSYAYIVAIDGALVCVDGADAAYRWSGDGRMELIALRRCRNAADVVAYCRNAWTGCDWPLAGSDDDDYRVVAVADRNGVRWYL